MVRQRLLFIPALVLLTPPLILSSALLISRLFKLSPGRPDCPMQSFQWAATNPVFLAPLKISQRLSSTEIYERLLNRKLQCCHTQWVRWPERA